MEFINSKELENNILESNIFKIYSKKEETVSSDHKIFKWNLIYDNNHFDLLLSNSEKFCFLKSDYYNFDDTNLEICKNINLLDFNKLLDIILSKLKIKEDRNEYINNFEDKLSLFHKNDIKSKYEIDINKIREFYHKFDHIEEY